MPCRGFEEGCRFLDRYQSGNEVRSFNPMLPFMRVGSANVEATWGYVKLAGALKCIV